MTLIELVGYLGSFLVLVSFLMTSVYKLRIVNTIGSVIFAVYALIIHSYPTALMNVCLVLINLRFLWTMTHSRKEYECIRVRGDDLFLEHFIDTYADDIQTVFPGLLLDVSDADLVFLVNCENRPAAVFAGRGTDGVLDILLDYSVPEYRDFTVGMYLWEILPEYGVHTLMYSGPAEHHTEYLKKMGFQKEGDRYVCRLNA